MISNNLQIIRSIFDTICKLFVLFDIIAIFADYLFDYLGPFNFGIICWQII